MGGKAGVTHFHVGPGKKRLALLHKLLDTYDIPPACLYPTHINRNEALIDDGIALAKRGAYLDMDTTEEKLGAHLCYYRKQGGPLAQLTVSSDAHTPGGSPRKLYEQFVKCVREDDWPLAELLPLFTSNAAKILKLPGKGCLEKGKDADVLVLDQETLAIVHVFTRGRHVIKEGELVAPIKQEQQVTQGKE
jgi:beta-aspartyl-dipeptidase (metallo-type)